MDAGGIEQAVVALAGVPSMRSLYGERHAATLRQADEAAQCIEAARSTRARLSICLMPGKIVVGGESHAPDQPSAIAAIDRLISLGATSVTIRSGVTMVSVLEAVRALETGEPVASGAPIAFGRASVEGAEESGGSSGQTSVPHEQAAPSADVTTRQAIRSAWKGVRSGTGDELAPLVSLAADIAQAARSGAGTVLPMARLVDHDEYTFAHTVNVGLLASALASAAGLSPRRVEEVTVGALLHDIGKLQVPKQILSKEGPLDDDERAVVMQHPATGASLLYGAPGVPRVAALIAFEHHMNLDGTGYPKRTRRWEISTESQIVHIADVFDALRTHRPYRRAMDEGKALGIMGKDSGVAFDPQLLQVFIDAVVHREAA